MEEKAKTMRNPDLKKIARDVRCDVISSIAHLGIGHIGIHLMHKKELAGEK